MNRYLGKTEDDIPRNGGAWVAEHQDAHEKWNFLNYDGYCYGFVMNKGDQFHLERIDPSARNSSTIDGVTVVWCACKDETAGSETVIVGWYENATVYREYQDCVATPISGIERCYFAKAMAEDCYLLPEELRTFPIHRAGRVGKGRGFGQSNFWYADSAYAQAELIPQVLTYFEQVKDRRINRLDLDFLSCENLGTPLTQEETELANLYYDSGDYFAFLPYAYRIFHQSKAGDDAFWVASALKELHQYGAALEWYKKVIEIEGDNWDTCSKLPYLYGQCLQFEESLTAAQKLLTFPEAKQEEVRDEIYNLIADDLYWLNRIEEAISWLDRLLSESKDSEQLTSAQATKNDWLKLL